MGSADTVTLERWREGDTPRYLTCPWCWTLNRDGIEYEAEGNIPHTGLSHVFLYYGRCPACNGFLYQVELALVPGLPKGQRGENLFNLTARERIGYWAHYHRLTWWVEELRDVESVTIHRPGRGFSKRNVPQVQYHSFDAIAVDCSIYTQAARIAELMEPVILDIQWPAVTP